VGFILLAFLIDLSGPWTPYISQLERGVFLLVASDSKTPAMKFLSLLPFALGIAVSAAPAANGPTHSGDGTFTTFGLGSCGSTNNNNQLVVGVSTEFFNNFPGGGSNPNDNPICGRQIQASFNHTTVTVEIVDTCVGCAEFDLNFSPAAFTKFAKESVGRIHGVSWFVVGGGE